MKHRKLIVFGLIFSLLTFLSAFAGVAWYYLTRQPSELANGPTYFYYTINSNIFVGITSFIGVISSAMCLTRREDKVSKLALVLKFSGVAVVTLTFITVCFWLMTGTFEAASLVNDFNIFLHFLTPILALVTFILFDHYTKRLKYIDVLLAYIPTLIYTVIYVLLVAAFNKQEYNVYLFGVRDGVFSLTDGLVDLLIMLAVSFALFNATFFLHKLFRKFMYREPRTNLAAHEEIFGVNVIDEQAEKQAEKDAEAKKEAEEIAQVKEEDKIAKETQKAKEKKAKELAKKELNPQEKPKTAEKTGPRVYHISRSSKQEGMWQVKLASGEKAVKLFKTQKEAIDYAKSLVNTNGGSIRIHSMKGKIRK